MNIQSESASNIQGIKNLPKGTHNSCSNMTFTSTKHLRQTKVRYFGIKLVINQDIAGLDVTVNNFWFDCLM